MRTKTLHIKNRIMFVLAVLLIAALAIGGSLAYLSARTEKLENEFSFVDSNGSSGGMKVDIDEPNWDEENAQDMIPGEVVPKDPLVINTSTRDVDEWVALKLVIRKRGSEAALNAQEAAVFDQNFDLNILFDGNTNGTQGNKTWTKLGSITPVDAGASAYEGVYMYNAILPADSDHTGDGRNISEPLFTQVVYNKLVDGNTISVIETEWEGFQIVLTGYAVQAKHVEWEILPGVWKNVIE